MVERGGVSVFKPLRLVLGDEISLRFLLSSCTCAEQVLSPCSFSSSLLSLSGGEHLTEQRNLPGGIKFAGPSLCLVKGH